MQKSRALTAALIVGAFAAVSVFAAAPVSAAPLPAGQKLTTIGGNDAQFYDIDSTTGALTPVGVGVFEDTVRALDVDDTGAGFAISNVYEGSEVPEAAGSYLSAADASTGTLTYVADIAFSIGDSTQAMDECTGIDYTGGQLLLACMEYDDDGEGDAAYLGVWDFETGTANPLLTLTGRDYKEISEIALDPITGSLYVFTFEDYYYGIYTMSIVDGLVPVTDSGEYMVYGADFDRDGQLWVVTYRTNPVSRAIDPNEPGIATMDPAAGDVTFSAAFLVEDYLPSLTVWGALPVPLLPATGAAGLGVPAVAAAVLLLGGAVLAGLAVRRRRTA